MIGRIYFIENKINNDLYIGSTTRDIYERLKEHKRDITKYPNFKLHKAMKRNNPFFNILLIEELEVSNIEELRTREGDDIKFSMPALNTNIPGRDIKQYQIDNKEKLRVYRNNYYRKYRKHNYNALKKYRQEYYKNKKEKYKKYNILKYIIFLKYIF